MANNQAKRVLIFSTAYSPLIGGAEIAVNEITKRLPNWQFDLVTAKINKGLKKEERINNINVYRVGYGFNFDKYLLPFLGLRFKKKYPNIPWLLTLQEGDPPEEIEKKVGVFKYWFYQIFQKADYFQAISSFLYQWAHQMGAKQGEVVSNGVDLEVFRLRANLNNRDKKVILTVSRLVKKNGVDDLIKAGQYLDFDFKILIVGDGPDKIKLEKLVKELNLEDKVIFQGQVEYQDLPKYYSSADIFVRASLSEGLGISFLEAMATGLPIIGTSVGGIPDFLEDRKIGLFCKVNNPQDIANKIKEILENDDLRKCLVNNSLELIKKEYNWDNIVLKMENIYDKIIS